MAAEIFYIKQNDTSPAIAGALKDADGNAVNVSGSTIKFNMRSRGGAVKIDEGSGAVVSGVSGTVKYVWQAGDTDTAGTYEAEFEVTYTDATKETFPNNGYISVVITPEIS